MKGEEGERAGYPEGEEADDGEDGMVEGIERAVLLLTMVLQGVCKCDGTGLSFLKAFFWGVVAVVVARKSVRGGLEGRWEGRKGGVAV